MKLIQSKVELIEQGNSIEDIYKHIELCSRVCYKSEDKITPDSAKEFVDRMINSGHGAMLEHGTVYLKLEGINKSWEYYHAQEYLENNYSKVVIEREDIDSTDWCKFYITTNFRVLIENNWLNDLKYICEPTKYHERRITVKFTCDRGVSHEFVRHRVFSFAQESTRFCNYSKDKFGNEITFIQSDYFTNNNSTKMDESNINYFEQSLKDSERYYFKLLELGWKPQQARQVLPNALKTELIMTGFESDWKHFFDLRCAKNAHPDAQKLANELKELMYGSKEV